MRQSYLFTITKRRTLRYMRRVRRRERQQIVRSRGGPLGTVRRGTL